MFNKQKTYTDRTITSFGVTIGTGLMLESVFDPTTERYDPDREIPVKVNINDYKKHYLNIYTLARNVINSLQDKSIRETVFYDIRLLNTVLEDVNIISNLYDDTKCELVLFVPKYDKVMKHLNKDKEGTVNLKELEIYNYINKFLKKKPVDLTCSVEFGDYRLHAGLGKILITTHITADLLNVRKVKGLILLESHTGKIKYPDEWYTKYHKIGTKPLNVFPFMEELLYILGDKTFVRPFSVKVRRELHNLAIDKKWTSHSSRIKILQDLRSDPIVGELVRNYTNLY